MPIQAAPLVAQKMALDDRTVDPSGDTWVYVRPATGREHLSRAEMLKEISYEPNGAVVVRANPILLQFEEIWLTAGNEDGKVGNIVVHRGDDKRIFFEKSIKDYTRSEFMEELADLPPIVLANWVVVVRRLNAAWRNPF